MDLGWLAAPPCPLPKIKVLYTPSLLDPFYMEVFFVSILSGDWDATELKI